MDIGSAFQLSQETMPRPQFNCRNKMNDNRAEPDHEQIQFKDVALRLRALGIDADTLLNKPLEQHTKNSAEMNKTSKIQNTINNKHSTTNSTAVHDFFMYQLGQKLTRQGEVVFYVEAVDLKKKKLPKSPNFSITVDTPRGHTAFVRVLVDELQPQRYVCTFRAVYSGNYAIRALVGAENIKGSPSFVSIWSRSELTDVFSSIVRQVSDYFSTPAFEKILNLPSNSDNSAYFALQILESAPRSIKPWGIAAHPFTQHIYVTDRDGHEVCCYAFQNQQVTFLYKFGKSGPRLENLNRPTGIAVDVTNNRLIIADKDNHRICAFQFNGTFITAFGQEGHKNGDFQYPWGVAVCPNGTLIAVADSRNHRLQLFNGNGVFLCKYSPFESSPHNYKHVFDYPRGIAFDNIGSTMYVTDFNLQTVFAFSTDFNRKRTLTPRRDGLKRPQGIAINSAGNISVCDTKSHAIRIISPAGELLTTFASTAHGPLEEPIDITACAEGRLFVLESSGRISALKTTGY